MNAATTAAVVAAVASVAAAVGTLAYVVLTYRMVSEMRRTRLAQVRPYVYMDVARQESNILLVVTNSGNGPAANVAFRFDRPIVTYENKQAGDRIEPTAWPLLAKGIPFLPPGREIVSSAGTFSEYFRAVEEDGRPLSYAGRVRYTNALTGEAYEEGIVLDFEHFRETMWVHQRDMDDLVKEVQQIRKILRKP